MAAAERKLSSLNIRSQKDWHTLCSEYNLCKRKLQAKKDALLILAEELDNVRQEKDAFRLMAEQLREKCQALKKEYTERERALGLSLNESDPLSERRNHSLVQVLREAREQNKKAEAMIADLEQNLMEAQGDIKLLRENIARQRIGDDGIGTRHFPAHEREELVNQLEATREQLQALEQDLVAKIDEQMELVTERGYFRDKAERLNQELNYILGGDEKRIVDVDALIMENKYLKERLKQAQEEKSKFETTVRKYKAAIERKRGKSSIKLGSTASGGFFVSPKQVEQLLAEGKAGGIAATPSSVADLQSLAAALLETIHDKNMAVNHHRNTNKILGNRVAELEKKLKTLEISGLWNLPPGKNAAFVASEIHNMQSGLSSLLPHQPSDVSDSNRTESRTSLPVSVNSSTQNSPSHIVDDKLDIKKLLHEVGDDSSSYRGSLEYATSNDNCRNWCDSLSQEHAMSPSSISTTSNQVTASLPDGSTQDMEKPRESDPLLAKSTSGSLCLGSLYPVDPDMYISSLTERSDQTKLPMDQVECDENNQTDITLNKSHSISPEIQDSLDSVEDLLETVSDKLSCRRRGLLLPKGFSTTSPESSSPLLSRDKQTTNDKQAKPQPITPVDTAPHCV